MTTEPTATTELTQERFDKIQRIAHAIVGMIKVNGVVNGVGLPGDVGMIAAHAYAHLIAEYFKPEAFPELVDYVVQVARKIREAEDAAKAAEAATPPELRECAGSA